MSYKLIIFKKITSVVLHIVPEKYNFTLLSSSVGRFVCVCDCVKESTREIRIRAKGNISCLHSGDRNTPVSLALTA